ncbi:aminoglycoside phosphotransferase family protein [Actinopolymorpha pittospori]
MNGRPPTSIESTSGTPAATAPSATATTGTRAAGVRLPYDALPHAVRGWVERELGSSVVSAASQTGGFSPGPAARLVTAGGRRAFVKAVGSALNPDSPRILRAEVAAMRALPELPWLPRVYATYDDGDWIALLLEDVDGREPAHPWVGEDVDLVLGALAELTAALTPTPWPDAPRLEDNSTFTGGWATLSEAPPDDLDPWALAHLDRLATSGERARLLVPGESLVHWDIRADNVLVTDAGRVVFIDWAWAAKGAGWVDTAVTCLDLVTSGTTVDVDALLARHPLTGDVDPDDVTTLVEAVTGMLTERSRQPAPPDLPTLRTYQRTTADAQLAWLRRRRG